MHFSSSVRAANSVCGYKGRLFHLRLARFICPKRGTVSAARVGFTVVFACQCHGFVEFHSPLCALWLKCRCSLLTDSCV